MLAFSNKFRVKIFKGNRCGILYCKKFLSVFLHRNNTAEDNTHEFYLVLLRLRVRDVM